jgi:dihydropteroate synthase
MRIKIIDPGIGFAKGEDQNIQILSPKGLQHLKSTLLNRPLLIGLSRKRFIKSILKKTFPPSLSAETVQDYGSAGACCAAYLGGADIFRTHDVKVLRATLETFRAIHNIDKDS